MTVAPIGAVVAPDPAATAAGRPAPRAQETDAARAATAFERVLLEQLTQQLAASAAPDDADGGASAATNAYRDMLPGAMADALSQSGGIGIAAQLQAALAPPTPAPAVAPSTGSRS